MQGAAASLPPPALKTSPPHLTQPAVDAWNDVVASARSIMYSIADPAAVFDVFWFSNEVRRGGGWSLGIW